MKMRRWATGIAAIAAAAAVAGAAGACEPVPPDQMPSAEEILESRFRHSTGIVYAVVTKRGRSLVPFKVLHVYKGPLKPGARLKLRPKLLGCPTGEKPWPTFKGRTGVIGVYDDEFLFLDPHELEGMFEKGSIRRAAGG